MSDSTQMAGKVLTLWRYPIKSMLGEELNATAVTTRGLLGDRAYALVDQATTKVASAKHPEEMAAPVRLPRGFCRSSPLRDAAACSADHAAGWDDTL